VWHLPQRDSCATCQPEPCPPRARGAPHFAFIRTSRSAPKSSPCIAQPRALAQAAKQLLPLATNQPGPWCDGVRNGVTVHDNWWSCLTVGEHAVRDPAQCQTQGAGEDGLGRPRNARDDSRGRGGLGARAPAGIEVAHQENVSSRHGCAALAGRFGGIDAIKLRERLLPLTPRPDFGNHLALVHLCCLLASLLPVHPTPHQLSRASCPAFGARGGGDLA
jgi:hypothetical protein